MKRAIETVPVRKYSLLLVLVLIWGGPLAAQEADPESLNRRGVEAGSEQNYDEARQNFTDAAREYDQLSSRVLHNRGRVYEEQGNIPAAVESYAEAVRRNPDQYQSLERLGYWKYKHGDYAEAVDLGERALSLDPDNPNVKGWIEDAYRKKIEDIEKTAARKQKDDRERYYTTDGDHFPPRYDPLDRHRTELHVTFDFMLRFSHDLEEETLGYEWTPGQIMNFPYTLSAVYRPYREWAFYGELSHQYTGAALPDVSGQSERFEVWYYWKKFIFGGGIFMHHYNGDFFNSEELSMMDLKAGGSLHYESRETVVDAVLYPRLIVPDGQWSSKLTYDIAYNEVRYGFRFSPSLMYYTRVTQADFYFFNHELEYSDYYGYFDIALGGEIVNHTLLDTVDIAFEGEAAYRINLEKRGADNPYAFFNGQGLLGIDIYQDGGSFFSGQKSSGTILMLGIRERFSSRFFAYQRLYADFPGHEVPYQDYLLQFGLGYVQ